MKRKVVLLFRKVIFNLELRITVKFCFRKILTEKALFKCLDTSGISDERANKLANFRSKCTFKLDSQYTDFERE